MRRVMRRIWSMSFVFAVVAAATVLTAASPAGTCDCAAVATDAEAFERADVVFIGAVEQIYDARSGSADNPEVVVLQVSDVYKGEVTQTQGIVTRADSASCGYEFVTGEVYVVFANTGSLLDIDPGFYETAQCDGTRLLDDQVPELGVTPALPAEGEPTVAQIQAQLGATRTSLVPEMLILAGVLAFVLGLAAWFRARTARRSSVGLRSGGTHAGSRRPHRGRHRSRRASVSRSPNGSSPRGCRW